MNCRRDGCIEEAAYLDELCVRCKADEYALPGPAPIGDPETDEHGRRFYFCEVLDTQPPKDSKEGKDWFKKQATCTRSEANLISSDCGQGVHKPVLDFDFPCRLVPSSTPGNFHLYIDKPMAWGTYENLLRALQEAGLLQKGFATNSIKRHASFVRPPWIKKKEKANV